MRLFLFILSFFAVIAVPTQAQQSLVLNLERTLTIGEGEQATTFCTHEAYDTQSRTIGLMFQTSLPVHGGMIFDFKRNDIASMWMKNTLISLDMLFITSDKKVAKIAARTTPKSLAIISSDVPVRYVLELNAGAAAKFGLKVGDSVTFWKKNCVLPKS